MKIQVIKLPVFIALLTTFHAFDGFNRPVAARDDYRSPARMARAWFATVIMFVTGAVMALWGNAIAQHIDWNIPDGLYPFMGVMLLIAGFVWMLMVRSSVRI